MPATTSPSARDLAMQPLTSSDAVATTQQIIREGGEDVEAAHRGEHGHAGEHDGDHAGSHDNTWACSNTELFFDLVYVVIIHNVTEPLENTKESVLPWAWARV